MSPEQANGREADRTSDVWAFGCVLYEMLTGRRAFDGETVSEILAGVLKADLDWHRLPAETPEGIRRLLRRSLQKDQKLRFCDIRDARLEIDDAQSEPQQDARFAHPRLPKRGSKSTRRRPGIHRWRFRPMDCRLSSRPGPCFSGRPVVRDELRPGTS